MNLEIVNHFGNNALFKSALGFCVYKDTKHQVLCAWDSNTILTFKYDESKTDAGKLQVSSINPGSIDILENRKCLCSLDVGGNIRVIQPFAELSKSESDEDLFTQGSQEERHCLTTIDLERDKALCFAPYSGGLMVVCLSSGVVWLSTVLMFKDSSSYEVKSLVTVCPLKYNDSSVSACIEVLNLNEVPANVYKSIFQSRVPESSDSQLVIIGLSNGFVYAVDTSKCCVEVIYKSSQSVNKIIILKDKRSADFNIGIFLDGGVFLLMTHGNTEKEILYHMLHLPCSMVCILPISNQWLISDGIDLWQCQLFFSDKWEIKAKLLPVKGVCYLSMMNENEIFSLTVDGVFYKFNLLDMKSDDCKLIHGKNLGFSKIIDSFNHTCKCLSKLKIEKEKEDKLLQALSLASRNELLEGKIKLNLKIYDLPVASSSGSEVTRVDDEDIEMFINKCGKYMFEIYLENCADYAIPEKLWSIGIIVRYTKENVVKTFDLKETFRKNSQIKICLPIEFEKLSFPVKLECFLFCLKLGDEPSDGSWFVIPMISQSVDSSYFFTPFINVRRRDKVDSNLQSLENNLNKLCKCYGCVLNHQSDGVNVSETNSINYTLQLTLKAGRTVKQIWNFVLVNCEHRSNFDILLWINSSEVTNTLWLFLCGVVIKLVLNDSCTILTASCSCLETLITVRRGLLSTLLSAIEDDNVNIEKRFLTQAQEYKLLVEAEDVEHLRKEWRDNVTSWLPL